MGPKPAELSGNGIAICENIDTSLASLSARLGQEAAFTSIARQVFGKALPAAQGAFSSDEYSIFWTGPDQYFVEAPIEAGDTIEAQLKAPFGETASITDQSGGWVRLDVSGSRVVALMERLCVVDLQTTPSERAIRTVIEHVGCFIVTRNDGISIWAPRSYAGSIFHALKVTVESI